MHLLQNGPLLLQKALIKHLGETNTLEDADLVFTIFRNSDNNQLVRTAAEALGKIGAVQYSDSLIELMEDANTKQYFLITQGYENTLKENEQNAWSCVLALESLHTKACYEPLFHAQFSGYTKEYILDKAPMMEGRYMSMLLSPKGKK